MSSATPTVREEGSGWVAFAGIMLILAGAIDFFDGIRAIGANTASFDTIFWDNNLEAWGWFYLIVGIILIVTGFFVFQRAPWAVTVGIIAATVSAVFHMWWIFAYPIVSLILVLIDLLVIYGLVVYGSDEGNAY
jgi:cytochrome b subunit of formate dehydrogenase